MADIHLNSITLSAEHPGEILKCELEARGMSQKDLAEAIGKLKDLFCNNSVKLIYAYSKNRSIIEHLRCSLMHGSYTYNEIDNTFKFSDYWKGEDQFNKTISLKDFKMIFGD